MDGRLQAGGHQWLGRFTRSHAATALTLHARFQKLTFGDEEKAL